MTLQEQLDQMLDQMVKKHGTNHASYVPAKDFPGYEFIHNASLEQLAEIIMILHEQLVPLVVEFKNTWDPVTRNRTVSFEEQYRISNARTWYKVLIETIIKKKLPFDEAQFVRLLQITTKMSLDGNSWEISIIGVLGNLEAAWKRFSTSEAIRLECKELHKTLRSLSHPSYGGEIQLFRLAAQRISKLMPELEPPLISPGEPWSDQAIADLANMPANEQQQWQQLLYECREGGKGKLTPAWLKSITPLVRGISADQFRNLVMKWFRLIDATQINKEGKAEKLREFVTEDHNEILRGLVWCCSLVDDVEIIRSVAKLALSAYSKVPGKGPRFVGLGNACVSSLSAMTNVAAVGQLAVLKAKIKFGTAQKEIEKAFVAAANRAGLSRDDIEEIGLPEYGLEDVGVARCVFDEYRAIVHVTHHQATISWFNDATPLKSLPAVIKKSHPDDLKELQGTIKDLNAILPALRDRIENTYLNPKSWPIQLWQQRYLNHVLMGVVARRLIWIISEGSQNTVVIWHHDELQTIDGSRPIFSDKATVSLWHPLSGTTQEAHAWRLFIEEQQIRQPFKQAHREIYIVTDAERRTEVYSNRFAGHILRQHQYHALCANRGWKDQLRLAVDGGNSPTHRNLPTWNLRAEYWVEALNAHGNSTDITASGSFIHLVADQVRFYRQGAPMVSGHATGGGFQAPPNHEQPLRMEEVPPLVFSEIFRDIDLFVGVSSVGNDPNWLDHGREVAQQRYWQQYGFGELTETANTRRDLLSRVIPRLKIAKQCSFTDKFLVVKGTLRTYKIHFGSGNILMEPNDQYLCIVPKQSIEAKEKIFLPFEGDQTLSVILSKAFLLAADSKITDKTITSQIELKS